MAEKLSAPFRTGAYPHSPLTSHAASRTKESPVGTFSVGSFMAASGAGSAYSGNKRPRAHMETTGVKSDAPNGASGEQVDGGAEVLHHAHDEVPLIAITDKTILRSEPSGYEPILYAGSDVLGFLPLRMRNSKRDSNDSPPSDSAKRKSKNQNATAASSESMDATATSGKTNRRKSQGAPVRRGKETPLQSLAHDADSQAPAGSLMEKIHAAIEASGIVHKKVPDGRRAQKIRAAVTIGWTRVAGDEDSTEATSSRPSTTAKSGRSNANNNVSSSNDDFGPPPPHAADENDIWADT